MPAVAKHYDSLLNSAVKLFRQQGYAGTGLSEILADSGAPKGSLYHYFPGGKIAIGAAAVSRAGETVSTSLRELAASSASAVEMLERYFEMMSGWMAASGYRDGSPITTILLETLPGEVLIQEAGAAVLSDWSDILTQKAVSDGLSPERAAQLARFSLYALDGALVRCRVVENGEPLAEAVAELRRLYEPTMAG